MGCVQTNKKIMIDVVNNNLIQSPSKLTEDDDINYEKINDIYLKNMVHRIENSLWVKVIDFLEYNELKETGKICKSFNRIVKKNEILIKFFKKRNSDFYNIQNYKNNIRANKNKFSSFSDLKSSSIINVKSKINSV